MQDRRGRPLDGRRHVVHVVDGGCLHQQVLPGVGDRCCDHGCLTALGVLRLRLGRWCSSHLQACGAGYGALFSGELG